MAAYIAQDSMIITTDGTQFPCVPYLKPVRVTKRDRIAYHPTGHYVVQHNLGETYFVGPLWECRQRAEKWARQMAAVESYAALEVTSPDDDAIDDIIAANGFPRAPIAMAC